MGVFRQKVILVNAYDKALAKRKMIPPEEVRELEVSFLVDSGAYMLCINEEIQNQLGLDINDRQEGLLANGERQIFNIAGPVEIKIYNRRTITEAIVLPGNAEPLFGSIPLEALDLIVDSKEGALKLPPGRPYIAQTLLL
jgi:clan AA aspartic protease